MTGMIFDIQEMTLHDGPGARITFFMKGCPLRCVWCHNPEGQNSFPEKMFKKSRCIECGFCENKKYPERCTAGALTWCGKEMSVNEVVDYVLKLKDTLELMEGGVTFSGGEPCAQGEFLIECLKELKNHGIHTAIETCGYCDEDRFQQVIDLCDVIIMDIKLMDEKKHIQMTGVSNQLILKNAQILKNSGKKHIFRTPLIEGITDTKDNLLQIQSFVQDSAWEKIPSNPMASLKYEQLNRKYTLKDH